MADLVRHRPFKRANIRNNNFGRKFKKVKLIYPNFNIPVQYIWIVFIGAIFLYWIFFIINNTLLKPENYIQNISYWKYSVQMYDNPELYKKIGDIIRWENYYAVSKMKKRDILKQIKSDFVMVKDIEITQPQKYGAAVQFEFIEPEIVVNVWDKKFGIIWDSDFEIFSGNELWKDVFSVDLPQYASGINSLYWLFFEIPKDKFIYDMHVLAEWFSGYNRVVYLPWSSMTAVILSNWQRIYVNNQNSITWQIENYMNLMKFYDKASSLKIIDLWSLEWNKIIVQ